MSEMSSSQPHLFDEARWQEEIRRRELRRCAVTLFNLSNKVQLTEDFTTDTPRKLAILIGQTARILADHIPAAPASALGEVNDFLSRIAAHLRYVERARVAQTPWSIVEAAEHFLKQQAGPESNFIIRPTWSYNYSLVGEFWSFYREILSCWVWFPLDELKAHAKLNENEKIYCISFPRTERQNCLLHANWGHEVGHIIAAQWAANEFAALWVAAEPGVQNRIGAQVRQNPPPFEPLFKNIAILDIIARQTRAAMEAARYGLGELICDLIGVHLFGPSALAAAMEFAARFALDVSPLQCGYYPPWRYRLRNMIECCEEDLRSHAEVGYPSETIRPFFDWLNFGKNLTSKKDDEKVIQSSIVTKEAYKFIETNWSAISRKAISMLPAQSDKAYHLHERHSNIHRLVKRIENSIPPNEIECLGNSPAPFQDIISAAWVYKVAQFSGNPAWGTEKEFDLLFRLVLKACESSHVHTVWGKKIRAKES
jgi:hypothetical protein